MPNYFSGFEGKVPYHLSVGAVLRNDQGEVACHHFANLDGVGPDIYILMRETMEPTDAGVEGALERGLREEFGAKGHIVHFLGAITVELARHQPPVDKTTIYFACDLDAIDTSTRRPDDEEITSTIEWHAPEFLIERMTEQGQLYPDYPDLDESTVLRHLPILNAGI